jgi:hypothetical protein
MGNMGYGIWTGVGIGAVILGAGVGVDIGFDELVEF